MPIIVGDKPIFRIKFGDADIREVRKGDELQWGLYEITYINKGPKDVSTGYEQNKNIPMYVWGYPNRTSKDAYIYENTDEFPLTKPADATAVESATALNVEPSDDYGYKSHSDGWFNNGGCINNSQEITKDSLSYIPAITQDFYWDLTLFCKWRQRRYRFNGTYSWDAQETTTVGYWVWVED